MWRHGRTCEAVGERVGATTAKDFGFEVNDERYESGCR
jgi:hypothetical protein